MPFLTFTLVSPCRHLLAAAALVLTPAQALADFNLCNNTGSRVGIAVGYKETDGSWVTEGWWNLSARSCETVLKGTFMKGVGVRVLWPQLLFLMGFGVLVLAVAYALFRKRIRA